MKPPRLILSALPGLALAGLIFPGQPALAEASKEAETVKLGSLEWVRSTNGENMRWPDAVEYCEGLTLNGREDWRLPTLSELASLHDPQADDGIREPFTIDTCCLWSSESLVDRPAEDGDEIGGTPDRYQWGFMFDGGHHYYAVHIFEDGQGLCTRDTERP